MRILRLEQAIILSAVVISLLIGGGCGSDSPSEPEGDLPTTSITVNGFVKDFDGEPVSGVSVIVKGKTASVTNANGAFSISDVTTPYEIRVILSTQQTGVIYQGLTRPDPTLLYFTSLTTSKSATISGTVPPALGKITQVFFISGTKAWATTANQTTGAYSIFTNWKGSASTFDGKIHVLRWIPNPSNLPVQYDAYSSKDLTISSGGSFSGNNFAAVDLTDPADQSISGSITRPTTSYSITQKYLYLNFGNAFVFLAGEWGMGQSDNFSYTVPAITGATFEVNVGAEVSAIPNPRTSFYRKKGIAGGTSGIAITLENAPQLTLPANNGTGIDTMTQFLWAQGSGTGVNMGLIAPNIAGSGPIFYIVTANNSTSIPNLGPQGLGLPSNVLYNWQILRFFPLSSVDAAASDSFMPLVNGNGGETGSGRSETFQFTTSP